MEKKLRIGLFNDSFFPMVDGVTSVVHNYATCLSKRADVTVFVPDCSSSSFDDSVFPYRVVRCKSEKMSMIDYSLPLPSLDKAFMKTLLESTLDIVHIHSPFGLGKAGIHYAKKHRIPLIGTMHTQLKQDFLRTVKQPYIASIMTDIVKRRYNQCDECWAVNSEVARVYYEEYHYKTLPRIMNNATEMRPVEDKMAACAKINQMYDIPSDETVFLFVGRINKLKNIIFLANSLKILKESGAPSFKMLFVGSGQDEDALRETVRKNHMEDTIILCGRVMDRDLLAAFYARADLFLFPSMYDASSIVQIEAASQKTPGIFIQGAVTAATVKHRENGFVSAYDEKAYAQTIYAALENKALYETVCENAYRDLYVHWDDAIEEVYSAYQRMILEKNGHL